MASDSFKDYVVDLLHDLKDMRVRAMFGGWGLYKGEKFFGIIFKERLYFKTDSPSRRNFEQAHMQPFQPNDEQILRSYYEVPPNVLDDREELLVWAKRAARIP